MIKITLEEAAELFNIKCHKAAKKLMKHDRFLSPNSILTIDDLVILDQHFPLPNSTDDPDLQYYDEETFDEQYLNLTPALMSLLLEKEAPPGPIVTFTRPVTGWQIIYVLDKSEKLITHCVDFLKIHKSLDAKLTDSEVKKIAKYFEINHTIIDDDNHGNVPDEFNIGPNEPPSLKGTARF